MGVNQVSQSLNDLLVEDHPKIAGFGDVVNSSKNIVA